MSHRPDTLALKSSAVEGSIPHHTQPEWLSRTLQSRIIEEVSRLTPQFDRLTAKEQEELSILFIEHPEIMKKLFGRMFPKTGSASLTSVQGVFEGFIEDICTLLGCPKKPIEGCSQVWQGSCFNCPAERLRRRPCPRPKDQEVPHVEDDTRKQLREFIQLAFRMDFDILANIPDFFGNGGADLWLDFLGDWSRQKEFCPKRKKARHVVSETMPSRIVLFRRLVQLEAMLVDIHAQILQSDRAERYHILGMYMRMYEIHKCFKKESDMLYGNIGIEWGIFEKIAPLCATTPTWSRMLLASTCRIEIFRREFEAVQRNLKIDMFMFCAPFPDLVKRYSA